MATEPLRFSLDLLFQDSLALFLGSRGLHKETRQPAGPAGVTQVIYEMQFLFISSTAGRVKKCLRSNRGLVASACCVT